MYTSELEKSVLSSVFKWRPLGRGKPTRIHSSKLASIIMSRVYFLWLNNIPMSFLVTSIPRKYLRSPRFLIAKSLWRAALIEETFY